MCRLTMLDKSMWSILFLDLSVDEILRSEQSPPELMRAFNTQLQRDEITLQVEIECNGDHISKPRVGFVRAYYSTSSMFRATVTFIRPDQYTLKGRIRLESMTRILLQGAIVLSTAMCLLLILVNLINGNLRDIAFAARFEFYVLGLIFCMSLINFLFARRQKELIIAAFMNAEAHATATCSLENGCGTH